VTASSRSVHGSLLVLAMVAVTSGLDAQAQGTDRQCPGGNGIHISVTSGDSASGVSRIIDQSRALDTTIVFNIAERSWTRTNLAAAISVGLADEARGGYMICAGVTALMPSATLTVRGARGLVHFQASLGELTNAIRSAPGAVSPQPRRL
jgi:hypothetical protein